MHIVGRVAVGDVREALWRSRSRMQGSGPWTARLLDIAEGGLGPEWWDVELTGADARNIILPLHAGEPCHGDSLTLVGPEGLTVAAAAARLAAIEADYARRNLSCWGRIDAARREPITRVILATAPIDHEEYRELAPGPDAAKPAAGQPHLYCLDGRHRLVGWALAGALAPGTIVPAHVAGRMATA
ncbi:MAG: DUF6309 family protein [Chloroflexota bacterium]